MKMNKKKRRRLNPMRKRLLERPKTKQTSIMVYQSMFPSTTKMTKD
jgi:hypothetical protein